MAVISLCGLQALLRSSGEAESQTEVADFMEPTNWVPIPTRMLITAYLQLKLPAAFCC
jgi:hypothetical protein